MRLRARRLIVALALSLPLASCEGDQRAREARERVLRAVEAIEAAPAGSIPEAAVRELAASQRELIQAEDTGGSGWLGELLAGALEVGLAILGTNVLRNRSLPGTRRKR